MTSQLIILEVRGLWPIIITAGSLIVLVLVVYAVARINAALHYSKKDMPAKAQEKIDELAHNLWEAEIERDRLYAENKLLWNRLNKLVTQATRPLDIEQALAELKATERRA